MTDPDSVAILTARTAAIESKLLALTKELQDINLQVNQIVKSFNLKEGNWWRYNFKRDRKGYIIVYTTGVCENNGMSNAQAGFGVWFGPDHPMNLSNPVEGKAINLAKKKTESLNLMFIQFLLYHEFRY